MNWLIAWWYKRQRQIDLDILWPLIKKDAPSLDDAKACFGVHAFNDQAWMCLGVHEVMTRIDELT